MKVLKPEREVEVCDTCQHEGFLQVCLVCGKQFCMSCHGIIAGCWVSPNVCRGCSRRADVLKVVGLYAKQITPIIAERRAALEALPAESPETQEAKP